MKKLRSKACAATLLRKINDMQEAKEKAEEANSILFHMKNNVDIRIRKFFRSDGIHCDWQYNAIKREIKRDYNL